MNHRTDVYAIRPDARSPAEADAAIHMKLARSAIPVQGKDSSWEKSFPPSGSSAAGRMIDGSAPEMNYTSPCHTARS